MRLLLASFVIASIASSSTAQEIDDLTMRDQIAPHGGLRALQEGNLEQRWQFLGKGLCRRKTGGIPLYIANRFPELSLEQCRQICLGQSWCLAIEYAVDKSWRSRPIYCKLVTDLAILKAAGETPASTAWGADYFFDGVWWSIYCNNNDGCTEATTAFEGGSLASYPSRVEAGDMCWVRDDTPDALAEMYTSWDRNCWKSGNRPGPSFGPSPDYKHTLASCVELCKKSNGGVPCDVIEFGPTWGCIKCTDGVAESDLTYQGPNKYTMKTYAFSWN